MKEQVTELNIRREIVQELNRSKMNIKNMINVLPRNIDPKSSEKIKEVLSEIELFQKDIELSASGSKYAWFNENPSIKKDVIKDIEKLDREIIDRLRLLSKATTILLNETIEKKDRDIPMEIDKMRTYLTDVRFKYGNRNNLIKGV